MIRCTQRELREMIRDGIAKDAHSMPWEEYQGLHKKQIGYSADMNECNGQLFIDYTTGDWYANVGCDNWLR